MAAGGSLMAEAHLWSRAAGALSGLQAKGLATPGNTVPWPFESTWPNGIELQIPRTPTSPVPLFSLAPSPLTSHPVAHLINLLAVLLCFCAFYRCSFLCLECSLPQLPGKFLLTFKMWLRYCLLLHASPRTPILCAESHPFLRHLKLTT